MAFCNKGDAPESRDDPLDKVAARSSSFLLDLSDRDDRKNQAKKRSEVRKAAMAAAVKKSSAIHKHKHNSTAEALLLLETLEDTDGLNRTIKEQVSIKRYEGFVSSAGAAAPDGTFLELDRGSITACIIPVNGTHKYYIDFPETKMASLLRIEVAGLARGNKITMYVGLEAWPSQASFIWHCRQDEAINIPPEDKNFKNGRYYVTVYSEQSKALYRIRAQSMYHKPPVIHTYDRDAEKSLRDNLFMRVAESERNRKNSQIGSSHRKTIEERKKDFDIQDENVHQRFAEFEWLQGTMLPYSMASRAVSVKDFHFNPVRMRDALIQIHQKLDDHSTARLRHENAKVKTQDVCDYFVQEIAKTWAPAKIRPVSAPPSVTGRRSATPSSGIKQGLSSGNKHEVWKLTPQDARITTLIAHEAMPRSELAKLSKDHMDYRTHSWENLYFSLSAAGTLLQSLGVNEGTEEPVLQFQQLEEAESVELHDQPSTFYPFRLKSSDAEVTLAAYSDRDRSLWLQAAKIFIMHEQPKEFLRVSHPGLGSPMVGLKLRAHKKDRSSKAGLRSSPTLQRSGSQGSQSLLRPSSASLSQASSRQLVPQSIKGPSMHSAYSKPQSQDKYKREKLFNGVTNKPTDRKSTMSTQELVEELASEMRAMDEEQAEATIQLNIADGPFEEGLSEWILGGSTTASSTLRPSSAMNWKDDKNQSGARRPVSALK